MTEQVYFEWDESKNEDNIVKHGVSFYLAQYAFSDSERVVLKDLKHSQKEKRYYCLGKVGGDIITVRFTYRDNRIRILWAGFWRIGKKIYEEKNKI